ncbi:MAG: hypothetical protein CMF55_03410 [Legionellales bacterium]|nr:hypothetical protein [Legionellales bacterium]
MASVNKKFAVEKGLEVGDDALVVDAQTNKTGIGKTDAKYGLDVATTANFDGVLAAGQVGIGSTQPAENLDVIGGAKFQGAIKDRSGSAGTNGIVLISANSGNNVDWSDQAEIYTLASDANNSIQFKKASNGKFQGADNFVYDPTNKRVGIGSTLPEYLLQVARAPGDSANGYVQIGGTFLDSTGAVGIAKSILAASDTGELVWVGAGASVTNIIHVNADGDDGFDGFTLKTAKRTIGAACTMAQTGDTIRVAAGLYTEDNPVIVPNNVSIDGDDLRQTQITPSNTGVDLFHAKNGTLFQNLSFVGAANTGAVIAFPPDGSAGIITQSPYIRNCTNFIPNSQGLKIDGSHAEGLKSMNVDSYTQYNQGGIGVTVSNNAYAQLVSIFTICNVTGITAVSGAQCDVNNSNASFGTRGLVASGVGTVVQTGAVSVVGIVEDNIITVGSLTSRPHTGQAFYLGELFNNVRSISVTNAGSGYTNTNPPVITITDPTGPGGSTAEGIAVISGFGSVTSVEVNATGSQYRGAPTVTIAAPTSGVTATASATMAPVYYTINSATPVTSGVSTITIDQTLPNAVGIGSTVPFAKQSLILASSYTFEHVGSGLDINTARPSKGGVSIPANQAISEEGGKVVYTSTDERGNLKVGDNFTINQQTGDISGDAFKKSIQSQLTPLIIALGGQF